jgi:hypothetical protein
MTRHIIGICLLILFPKNLLFDSLCVMTNYLATYRGSKSTVKNRYINQGDTYFVTFNEVNCGDYTCVLGMWRMDIHMYLL